MNITRGLRGTAMAVLVAGATLAHAAIVQISQIADQPPDLAVFLAAGGLAPAAVSASQGAAGGPASAAFGSVPLKVKSLTAWDPASGVALVVALDVSASIGVANFETLKRHLGTVLTRLPARSQVALLAIGAEVRTVRPFGPLASALGPALDGLVPDSPETALYESVLAAQQLAAKAGPNLPLRRMVLLLTDGIDDSRRGFGREEVLRKIAAGDAPVYALGISPEKPSAAQREAIKALAQIARASGGAFVQSTAVQAEERLTLLMGQAMRAELLTLDCSACVRDGVARPLQISMQQRDATLTDSRELRLNALPAPGPGGTSASAVKTVGPASGASEPTPRPWDFKLIKPWVWTVPVLVLAGLGGLVWARQRKTHEPSQGEIKTDIRVDKRELPEDDSQTVAAGSSAGTGAGKRSVTLDVAGQGRMQVSVGSGDLVLGRSKAADVAMERDSEASTRHAALFVKNGAVMLRDLGSSNGTYLNGTRIVRPEPIQDRDLVMVGRTEVRVYFGAD